MLGLIHGGKISMPISEYFTDLTRVYVIGWFALSAGVLCCG